MTRVLSVASECVPLVKTGGLADVAGALPAALTGAGVEMRTLIPGYPAVMAALGPEAPVAFDLGDMYGAPVRVRRGALGDTVLYALEAPHLYDRPGSIYLGPDGKDWPDNPERFAALSFAAARIATDGIEGWNPEVLHLHDWQAGLTPVYLQQMGAADRVATLLTVHNIAFQGLAPAIRAVPLGLPLHGFHPQGFEYYNKISALKAGLVYSDAINTVSPTYAAELMTPEFGMGLDGVMRDRRAVVSGILNGIDLDAWTPPYKTPAGKAKQTAALRKVMRLPPSDGPLCVVISRLTEQKGLDLLLEVLPDLLATGAQLALLGSGNADLETAFRNAAERNTGVSVRIGYDEELAHQLIAGGDVILVPSRFEPCGLTQLYGLRYGTLPLVSLTGGLADTVIPASAAGIAAKVATGLQFFPVDAQSLRGTVVRMGALWHNREVWQTMMRNAMAHPVGWDQSARDYAALYDSLKKAP
ncbi:glycogen synthase GlgA [Puniceibacterium sp. IMCC21224]|uniref:glycogen synthase GlgA n=1 Tax=Puniceibacterium sp. IMCC21224 TaxID=1618204 RepID=UPI00064DBE72|nr:glycogen synthase GlgA [Puniceibacterium sp. IMCC21224]KMK67436.1 glycogen/starch synthase, ADP-glucose type [Puniceibacterium sp. IMCC21224]